MTAEDPHPIPNSYWVAPGSLLAGAYPSDPKQPAAKEKIRRLLEAGITVFVDLTEEGEYSSNPYGPILAEETRGMNHVIRRLRRPIPDMSVPTLEEMDETLNAIDTAVDAGEKVFVHCFGGRGRTGTVVGCYLVRHGWAGQAALEEISRLRLGLANAAFDSPETFEQKLFVLNWGLVHR